jgi:signal transduction histidine kinase
MSFLKEKFGLKKVELNKKQEKQLYKELEKIDSNRISFFAFITFITSSIFLVLDIFIPYDNIQAYYIAVDSIFLIISLLVVINTVYQDNISNGNSHKHYEGVLHKTYPAAMLIWGTAIAATDPGSVLNILTYYIVAFLIAFTLVIPLFRFAIYFIIVILVYSLFCFLTNEPFFTETLIYLCLGALITLPFYRTFLVSRINSQAAIIKLNLSKENLTKKVDQRTTEMEQLNTELKNEINQRKIAERRLRKALKKVEASDQLKSEFLANISHEIRTPLNSIIGFTEMMTEEGVDNERKNEYQKLVASNTMYLLSTFDDIFDASFVKTNKFKAVKNPVNISNFLKIIEYETNGIKIKHNKENIKLELIYPNNTDTTINTDEYLLKKALLRLIDNAFKFTNSGSVKLGFLEDPDSYLFFVEDTGIGVDQKDYSKILLPFVQGDGSFSRGYGGSGLGLTIVSGISKALNCKFDFDTEIKKGSTFKLIFNKHTS